jgi:hypothetical protein
MLIKEQNNMSLSLSTKKNYCCTGCNKEYTRKSSLDKHQILCDFRMKTPRELQIETEELGDTPTHYQLVKIVQELSLKIVKMEESMEEMKKWVDKKKQKLDIITWLNTNIIPTIGFLEWVNTQIIVKPEHFIYLMENTIFQTIQQIFEENICDKSDFICPISCFSQKNGVFYICEKKRDGTAEWKKLVLEDFILLLRIAQKGITRELTKWKEQNQHKFDDSRISVIFNKAVIKLMDISFSQDNNMSRMKNGLYNYLKKDLKSFEYEFEF